MVKMFEVAKLEMQSVSETRIAALVKIKSKARTRRRLGELLHRLANSGSFPQMNNCEAENTHGDEGDHQKSERAKKFAEHIFETPNRLRQHAVNNAIVEIP